MQVTRSSDAGSGDKLSILAAFCASSGALGLIRRLTEFYQPHPMPSFTLVTRVTCYVFPNAHLGRGHLNAIGPTFRSIPSTILSWVGRDHWLGRTPPSAEHTTPLQKANSTVTNVTSLSCTASRTRQRPPRVSLRQSRPHVARAPFSRLAAPAVSRLRASFSTQ